jgi:hypothetical protein
MGHPDSNALALKALVFGKPLAYVGSVNIAIDSNHWSPPFQVFGDGQLAEVAGMPDFVARCQVFIPTRVDVAVGVGQQYHSQSSWA